MWGLTSAAGAYAGLGNVGPDRDEQADHGAGDDGGEAGAVGAGFGDHGFVVFFDLAAEGGVLDGLHGRGDDFVVPVVAVGVGLAVKAARAGVRSWRKVMKMVRREVRRKETAILTEVLEILLRMQ